MIDAPLVRTTSIGTFGFGAVLAGAATAIAGLPAAAGVAAGLALGLLPIVSWAFLLKPLLEERGVWLFAAITLGKFILYAAALYQLVLVPRVPAAALGAGLLLPHLVLAAAALRARPAELRA